MSLTTSPPSWLSTFTLHAEVSFDDENLSSPSTSVSLSLDELNRVCNSGEHIPSQDDSTAEDRGENVFVVESAKIQLSMNQHRLSPSTQQQQRYLAAILVPSCFMDSALATCCQFPPHSTITCLKEEETRIRLSREILSRIHSVFEGQQIRGILRTNKRPAAVAAAATSVGNGSSTTNGDPSGGPADVLLLDVPQPQLIADWMAATNGHAFLELPHAVIKLLLISDFHVRSSRDETTVRSTSQATSSTSFTAQSLYVPTCAVCLHRIDPIRLGLCKPRNQDLCSKFCPTPVAVAASEPDTIQSLPMCPKQRFLLPWPLPSHCVACRVIHDYWTRTITLRQGEYHKDEESMDLFCHQCALQETLWVCLTCGFVGCGRYSNKHAEEHYNHSGNHPYSLELATLRIWDYVSGEFVHRGDLLECPCSAPLAPWRTVRSSNRSSGGRIPFESAQAVSSSSVSVPTATTRFKDDNIDTLYTTSESIHNMDLMTSSSSATAPQPLAQLPLYPPTSAIPSTSLEEKSPKKALMVGEEYEALLQSALEDQAQHYEGEIVRLRAQLTAEEVDESRLSREEQLQIEELKAEIGRLRTDVDCMGRELLDSQSQEAALRATSQRLLREQQVAEELLKKIQEETAKEHEQGRMQVEELEQQIADLTANLQMRHQFSQDEELNNAQIFGTAASSPAASRSSSKKGKKYRRFFRK